MDKTSKILAIVGIALIGSIALNQSPVDGATTRFISSALEILIEVQLDQVQQTNALIEQNYLILDELKITNQLLKADSNIFVAGLTDRFDLMEYQSSSSCVFYDRLEKEIQKGTCPIVGLTKDAFNSIITGLPQK